MTEDVRLEAIRNTVKEAEEIGSVSEIILHDAARDPGAPFSPDAVKELADLRRADRAAYQTLRRKLKEMSVRVSELDKAVAHEDKEERPSQNHANKLVALAESIELFHDRNKMPFACVPVGAGHETMPVKSSGFRQWLTRRYYEATGGAPGTEAMRSALNVLEANARYGGPEQQVSVRLAGVEDRIYLDLADETHRALEIDATGWRTISNPPVRFWRPNGLLPIAAPTEGGSVEELKEFLNLTSAEDFTLVASCLLAYLRPVGPYPLLTISGEQGSAKSTCLHILRQLVDPNSSPLRALPADQRELSIAAQNAHVLSYDNLSGITATIATAALSRRGVSRSPNRVPPAYPCTSADPAVVTA